MFTNVCCFHWALMKIEDTFCVYMWRRPTTDNDNKQQTDRQAHTQTENRVERGVSRKWDCCCWWRSLVDVVCIEDDGDDGDGDGVKNMEVKEEEGDGEGGVILLLLLIWYVDDGGELHEIMVMTVVILPLCVSIYIWEDDEWWMFAMYEREIGTNYFMRESVARTVILYVCYVALCMCGCLFVCRNCLLFLIDCTTMCACVKIDDWINLGVTYH